MARVGSAAVCSNPALFIWSKTPPPGHHGWVMWVMNGGAPTVHKGAAPFVVCMGHLSQTFKKTEIWNFLRYFPIKKKKSLKICGSKLKELLCRSKQNTSTDWILHPQATILLTLFSTVTTKRTDVWTRDSVLVLEALPSRS